MKSFLSLNERYLGLYYANKNNFTGTSYFFRAYSLARSIDLFLLKNYSITREEIKQIQRAFQQYWGDELMNRDIHQRREKLIKMYKYCESKLPYITNVYAKLEKYAEEENFDTGFNPGKWAPLIIAFEKMD